MCYGDNGTVKFFETLADNVFRHNYSMMQILKKIERWENFWVTQVYTLKGTNLLDKPTKCYMYCKVGNLWLKIN